MSAPHRTPLSQVRGLGAARSGTSHFWQQRVTSVALISLSVAFIVIVLMLLGRTHAGVIQILGSPIVAILMLLFIFTTAYHMWLGMQEIIIDYIHDDWMKLMLLMTNTFFCCAVGLACTFAILKLSFTV